MGCRVSAVGVASLMGASAGPRAADRGCELAKQESPSTQALNLPMVRTQSRAVSPASNCLGPCSGSRGCPLSISQIHDRERRLSELDAVAAVRYGTCLVAEARATR